MRDYSLYLIATLVLTACRGGAGLPGAPFAGASLLTPLSEAEEAHDALMHADLGRADSVARLGFVRGLGTVLTSDVVYLRGGLPIVRGEEAVLAIAAAEPVDRSTSMRWQPVRVETSRDGQSGYSYGYAIQGRSEAGAAPVLRVDRYIAFWRREASGWRIAAYAETYGTSPPPLALPPAAEPAVVPDLPMRRGRGPLDAIRAADVAFSADARRYGTGEAFGRFAAEEAQMFSGPGELTSGPQAIIRSFGPPTEGDLLAWHPVLGEVSKAGDLGFTVGNAVFTGRREDGGPVVRYSKYLTVWKKQFDGSWRFVVDGGSARPNQ